MELGILWWDAAFDPVLLGRDIRRKFPLVSESMRLGCFGVFCGSVGWIAGLVRRELRR